MEINSKLSSNLWKYYLFTSLAKFSFYTPIIQLFYLANNITIFKIAILGMVWSITRLILEIPSSILADRWGRKKTILLSFLFAVFQIITLIIVTEYWGFLIASVCSAASFAFFSGTDIAFFYDNLKVLKREKEFDKLWARQEIYQQIPLIIAFVSSGFLFNLYPTLPFQLSLIFLLASVIVIITLKEPSYHQPIGEKSIFFHFKQSTNFIFNNSSLKSLLIFTIIFSIGSDLSYGYGQIYLKQLSLPLVLFGIVYTFKSLLVTFSANFAPLLRRRFSDGLLLFYQMFSITILLLVMVIAKNYILGTIGFILIAIPYGLFMITKSTYIHDRIESNHRATVDSIFSFLIALTLLVVEPVFGYLADQYSIKMPLFIIVIILFVYCFYFLFYEYKRFNSPLDQKV
ncbi:MAG: MFS transporter [Candidatus Woesearchaeota archaeon]